MSHRFEGEFHQSQISDYVKCPKYFYYRNILGLKFDRKSAKMFFGTVMHWLIARLHESGDKAELWYDDYPSLRQVVDEMEDDEEVPIAWTDRDKEVDDWIEDAGLILKNYWAKDFNRNCEVILSEAKFTVNIAGFNFAGRIDQLRRTPRGEIMLIDFKTGTSQTNETLIELDYQLSIYAWAVMHGRFEKNGELFSLSKNEWPDKVGIYRTVDHLPYKRNGKTKNGSYSKGQERGQGLYTTTRTSDDFDAMQQDLGIICRSILGPHYDFKTKRLTKGGAFGRTPNIMNCVSCAFKSECLAERRKSLVVDEKIVDEGLKKLEEAGLKGEKV